MDYQLEIHHLDVGQGDSTLVTIRSGDQIDRSVLIDCGPCASTPRVIRYVKKHLGVKTLDFFVISHLHKDHMGSYGSVIEQLNPAKIYSNFEKSQKQSSHPFGSIPEIEEELLQFGKSGFKMTCVKNNSYFGTQAKDKINASSLAFLIEYGDFKYFTGGDIESVQEDSLLNGLGKLSAFKLSHHGSHFSTSQAFLDKTAPGLAFISCGQPDSPALTLNILLSWYWKI